MTLSGRNSTIPGKLVFILKWVFLSTNLRQFNLHGHPDIFHFLPELCNKVSAKCNITASQSVIPDSKVHGANVGPIWGRQVPGGPHVGPMNFAIWWHITASQLVNKYVTVGFLWSSFAKYGFEFFTFFMNIDGNVLNATNQSWWSFFFKMMITDILTHYPKIYRSYSAKWWSIFFKMPITDTLTHYPKIYRRCQLATMS